MLHDRRRGPGEKLRKHDLHASDARDARVDRQPFVQKIHAEPYARRTEGKLDPLIQLGKRILLGEVRNLATHPTHVVNEDAGISNTEVSIGIQVPRPALRRK
jgi:hypothetical protein